MKKLPLKSPATAILLAAVILAALLATGRLGPSSFIAMPRGPAKVTVAPVSLMDKETSLALAGAVEDRKATVITAQIGGRISEVYVGEGQAVKAGQPLAKIEGTGETAAAPVAQASPAGSQAAYENALKDYNRYQKLYEQGAVARRQLEAAAARLQAARDALTAAPAGGSAGPGGPAELTALQAGMVTGLTAAVGKTVQTGQQLMVLQQNAGEVRVVSHLAQKDLYLVRPGTPAKVSVAGAPDRTFTGRVEGIYPEAGVSPPTFRVHIQVEGAAGLLKPGMAAAVSLGTGQGAIVRAVPASAIVREQGQSYLFLAIDGKAVRQQVTTGAVSGDYIEITSDLSLGTLVVTGGGAGLKDGDPLELQ